MCEVGNNGAEIRYQISRMDKERLSELVEATFRSYPCVIQSAIEDLSSEKHWELREKVVEESDTYSGGNSNGASKSTFWL